MMGVRQYTMEFADMMMQSDLKRATYCQKRIILLGWRRLESSFCGIYSEAGDERCAERRSDRRFSASNHIAHHNPDQINKRNIDF
jgi:hypothetical protein